MEGVSLLPALHGGSLKRSQPLCWEHEGNWAIRDGKWKLVADGPGGSAELYDLDADRTETRNLAERYPERVAALAARWEEWARERHVAPWPWKPPFSVPQQK
jgi:arylsulfatase